MMGRFAGIASKAGITTMIRAGIGDRWMYERAGSPTSPVGADMKIVKRGGYLPNAKITGQRRGRYSLARRFIPTWGIIYRDGLAVSTWGKDCPTDPYNLTWATKQPGDSK